MKLLPTKFKWTGLATSFFALVFFIFINVYHKKNPVTHFELIKEVAKSCFILGLVIIMFSKEKFEDERTSIFRLNAFAFSFLVVIFTYIIHPFIATNQNETFFKIIFKMCLLYLMWYYFLKMDCFSFFKTKNEKQS